MTCEKCLNAALGNVGNKLRKSEQTIFSEGTRLVPLGHKMCPDKRQRIDKNSLNFYNEFQCIVLK